MGWSENSGILGTVRPPSKPRSVKTAEENRKRSSAFRSASPLIRMAKQKHGGTVGAKISEKTEALTSRIPFALGVLLIMAALFLVAIGKPVYNLMTQVEQRNKVAGLLATAEEQEKQYKEQLEQWEDPDFIKSQARTRLGYVMPHETRFVVADPGAEYEEIRSSYKRKVPARPWFLEISHSTYLASRKTHSQAISSSSKAPQPAPGATEAPQIEENKKRKSR